MSAHFLVHTAFLALATFLAYFWVSSPVLSTYTVQLIAALILLYFGTAWALRRHRTTRRTVISIDLVILTITILLLVTSTGGLTSPLFFGIYFLLFAVAMLFETEATLVLTGILIIYLILLPSTNLSDIGHLAELVAVLMITPLAIFTGHQHELNLEEKKKSHTLSHNLTHEETDTLLFLSLNLKTTLTRAIDTLSIILPTTTFANKANLTRLYQDLKVLYKSAGELEKTIDHETDQ
ncbi:MAG: hypothetical protein WCL07_01125 [bacterium]